MKRITFEEFVEKYQPLCPHNYLEDSHSGMAFETYGEDLEQVLTTVNNGHNNYCWTLVNCDEELDFIIPGYHIVNRQNYFITEVPWESEDIEVDMNETCHVNAAMYRVIEFMEEKGIWKEEFDDEFRNYWFEKLG